MATAKFPAQIKTWLDKVDNVDDVEAAHVNEAYAELIAIETALGEDLENIVKVDDYTAADVLAKLLTVDGTGSGLDADLLDGQHATAFAAASHGTHVSYGTTTAGLTSGGTGIAGSSGDVSRADHTHSLPSYPTSLPADGGNAATVGGFTVGVSVPAGAKFTDTAPSSSDINGNIKIDGTETNVYTHPTDDGSKHVPATGTTSNNKVLKAGSTAGAMSWETLSSSDVSLGNVDNTSDLNKPISTATQNALNNKADNSRVLTDVPANAKFTDTLTTISGKTGAIAKADITALGIPAQDTVYTHPANHPPSIITQDASNRFVTDTEKSTWNGKADKGTDYFATLTTSWVGASAPFTQEVTVTGITADDVPIIDIVLSSTLATAKTEVENWSKISKIETSANKITATCFEEKPTVALDLTVKVVG